MNCKNCGKTVYAKEICSCGETAPNKNGGGVLINSIICTILMVGTVIALILSISLRHIVNNDLLAETVKSIDLKDIEVTDDSGDRLKLDKWVYNKYIDDERISVKNVDNILEDPFIKDFLIDKIHGIQDFLMDEGDIVTIDSKDIIDLIDKNSSLLYNEAGLNFLEPDKDELKDNLSGLDDFAKFSKEHLSGWFFSGYIKSYFSFYYVCFLVILAIILLIQWLLVYRFNGRRMMSALRWYSIAFTAPSAVILILTSIPLIVFNSASAFENIPIGKLISPFCITAGILTGIGVLLLIASIIVKQVTTEKITAANTEAASGNVVKTDSAVDQVPSPSSSDLSNTEFAPVIDTVPADNISITNTSDDPANVNVNSTNEDNSVWARPQTYNNITPDDPEDNISDSVSNRSAQQSDNDIKKTVSATSKSENKTAAPVKEFVFCTKCGNKNRAGSSFCSKCGNKLRNR